MNRLKIFKDTFIFTLFETTIFFLGGVIFSLFQNDFSKLGRITIFYFFGMWIFNICLQKREKR